MQTDLFGKEIQIEESNCARTLKLYDETTFTERKKRCENLFSLVPDDRIWISSDESYFMWLEIRMAYISGCFISTILLALSFIERKFQADYHMLLYKDRPEWTLHQLLTAMRKEKSLDEYLIDRIDKLRLKRNPLVHFKNVNHTQSIAQRSSHDIDAAYQLIERDAKEAIEIMYAVSRMHLSGKAKF